MNTAAVQASSPPGGEQGHHVEFPQVPAPKYRHAAPSAPWPWMDFELDNSEVPRPSTERSEDTEWGGYPQSLFGNWTEEQVTRCQMLTKCSDSMQSTVYRLGVFDDGRFQRHAAADKRTVRTDDDVNLHAYWNHLGSSPPSNVRVQALFVEDMSLPVLQMLGTKYNVEPFFFASSVNWIPSRYREDPKPFDDHITIVLPFMRIFNQDQQPLARKSRIQTVGSTESQSHESVEEPLPYTQEKKFVGAQAPLSLPGEKLLAQDLLSLHMIRNTTTSTIISYHPSVQGTSARRLQSLVQRTGDSVYWKKIFARSNDPTFLFLSILWYALYEWDKAFEFLFRYITLLEYRILRADDMRLTRELHKLQEHLLYHEQLLRHFLLSVEFVRDTPNPAMNAPSISKAKREDSAKLLRTESDNLISEIKRLMEQKAMLVARLANAILLTFATVDIEDRNRMQVLATVSVQDSAALKKLAYMSTVFLPASYLSNMFSMNIKTFFDPEHQPNETLAHYIGSAVGLTFLTSWVLIALQKDSVFFPVGCGATRRIMWPFFCVYNVVRYVTEWFQRAHHRSEPSDAGSTLVSSAPDAGHL